MPESRPFDMLYIDPLFRMKGGASLTRTNGENLGVGETISVFERRLQSKINSRLHLTGTNALDLETLTREVTPSEIDMENTELKDVDSLSVVYTPQTQASKIGAVFDKLWESNRLVNDSVKDLRNDEKEKEKQHKKEKEEREKQWKEEREEREKQWKEETQRWRDEREKAVAELKEETQRWKGERKKVIAELKEESMKQRVADNLEHNKDSKYLKDKIEALEAKVESHEAKAESQATKILHLEAEVRTLQEAYRVLTVRMRPLFLRVLLDEARRKIARLLGDPSWDDISSNHLPSQLPTWLAQQRPLIESTRMLTTTSLELLSSPNPIRQEGNEVAHTATIEEIQEAILSRQQESTRVVLKNLFEFTYEMDLPLTTSS